MYKWLYGLICIGTVFRFFYPIFSHPLDHLYSDPARHYDNAFLENFGKSTASILDPPFPQIVFLLAQAFFGRSVIGSAVFFSILCAITPWFWYLWGKELYKSKEKALIFVVAIIFLPSWIGIFSYFMDEILLLPLMGAALWLSWRAKRKKTYSSLLLASCLWAFTIATKLNTMFELIIIFPWLCFSLGKYKSWNVRSMATMIASAAIIVVAYLMYPLWVYKGLGATWLFPPGQGALNRACFLSGADIASLSFTSQGNVVLDTGTFRSNALLSRSLPFTEWRTWRTGSCDQKIDLDRKFYIVAPAPEASWQKRLLYMAESTIYFFFSPSWTDDREDDFVQALQVQMRLIWLPLTLFILFLAVRKKAMREMIVVLFFATTILYVFSNSSTIIEGRYRKPWEGIAIATLIYLCSVPNSKTIKSIFGNFKMGGLK